MELIHSPHKFRLHYTILFFAVFCITMMAGLKPKGFRLINKVSPAANGDGLRFDVPGIAFTSQPFFTRDLDRMRIDGISLHLSLIPARSSFRYLARIFTISDSLYRDIITIDQWKTTLLIKGRDSRTNRPLHAGGVTVSIDTPVVLEISTGPRGTRVNANGSPVFSNPELDLLAGSQPAFLVVGNTPEGRTPWVGSLSTLSLSIEQPAETIESGKDPEMLIDYRFSSVDGESAGPNHGVYSLHIPRLFRILNRRPLRLPWEEEFKLSRSQVADIVVNFFGFIPFGFAIFFLILAWSRVSRKTALMSAIVLAFLTSLGIELAQSFMPFRTSEMLDLVLNTVGGGVGAFVGVWLRRLA